MSEEGSFSSLISSLASKDMHTLGLIEHIACSLISFLPSSYLSQVLKFVYVCLHVFMRGYVCGCVCVYVCIYV